MAKLRFKIAMTLDAYAAGPEQSKKNPLGVGGERLHEWAFPLAAWRAPHGLEGGEVNESTRVVEESLANIGARIMGRNMFGGHPGPWNARKPWNGWWGDNPPFHHPVLVLTHHARPPLVLQGGNSFTFVTEGIKSALEQARRAARGRDVIPTLLGAGEALFEGVSDLGGLRPVRTVAAPNVTHLKFARG